jgi:hypothetical protein
MRYLKTLRLAVCVHVTAIAIVSSTIVQEESVLLYEKNFNQGVGLGDADAALFRHFYYAIPRSSRWNNPVRNVVVAPFETPPLRDGFSGTFIFDTTAPDRSEFASRITDFREQLDAEGLRLYVGLSLSPNEPAVSAFGAPETTLGILDSRLPGSKLKFVRFDINKWRVSGGVVNYDVSISYWGQPAANAKSVPTVEI